MDLLSSIMKKMERPPAMGEKERKLLQQRKELEKKVQMEKELFVKEFKDKIGKRLQEFCASEEKDRLIFEPMDKFCRAILHDLSETANLTAHSFGQNDDRYVIVFKAEALPCDAELAALKRGELYDPNDDKRGSNEGEDEEDRSVPAKGNKKKEQASNTYFEKYEKHFKSGVGKNAAMKTEAEDGKTYGFVTKEQKRDRRTIEETLADIRARKRQKVDTTDDVGDEA